MEGKQGFPEEVLALMLYISALEVVGFNSIESSSYSNKLNPPRTCHHMGSELADSDDKFDESNSRSINHPRKHSVSMPVSPLADSFHDDNRHVLKDNNEMIVLNHSSAASQASSSQPNQVISQSMPKGCAFVEEDRFASITYHPNVKKLRDNRYNSFKTWSGKLERQLSHLHGRPRDPSPEPDVAMKLEREAVPVDRYFAALEGPELETLRSSEEILLPKDRTWPFLLRYPISSFGICLGVSSQAIMWKTLATSSSTKFLHISLDVNIVLWWISVALVVVTASAYILKLILYFEAVCREYYHPIRVNFFFAPWIALLFLALGVPPSVAQSLHTSLWYILMAPVLCLELKIYGQWMSGGQRRLSKVANPTNHLSVFGNFVGALLGASMGLKEGPLFFFAVGLAHYTVLFVTLYQSLPTNETLPKDLHPVFFLFVAAPSVGSMAWAKINGSFDYGARIAYFIALFLYFTLAVRVHFFRGFKFSLSWWAYTSPMTGVAIATIRYSNEVTTVVTQALAVILASASTLTLTALLVTTIVHAFVLGDLFPNDIAIAISDRKPKQHDKKWFHIRHGSSENKDIENYLKYANSDCTGIDASLDGSNKV